MPPCPDSPLHTPIPPADEKRLLYEGPGRVLTATPMKRVVEAVWLLDALEGMAAEAAEEALARARETVREGSPVWLSDDGTVTATPQDRPPDGTVTTSGEFAPGSIEIKHGEIPAAALGPEEPRCSVCGGPHVFADHFRDGPHRSDNGYILGMWCYEILDARYGGFCAFLNDCVREPEIMLSCGGKLWLVEIKDGVPAFVEAQPEWFSELRGLERTGLWDDATTNQRRVMPEVAP